MKTRKIFHIYINEASGTVQRIGKDAIKKAIDESDINAPNVIFEKPPALFEKIKETDENAHIIIGGGDGTIKSCAQILMKRDVAFGILPLGTMNLLARDFNLPPDIDGALAAYANGAIETQIDVGKVNDDIFLCCAGFGTIPETSRFREQHRGDSHPILIPRLTAYLLKQMDRLHRRKVTMIRDGNHHKIRTSALVISNNKYTPQGNWSEDNFKRESLQDGILGVYSAAPQTLWDKLRLLLRLGLGNWRDDTALKEWDCYNLTIKTKKPTALLSLDGEAQTFDMPLKFSSLKKRLKVLIPIGGERD